MNEKSDYMFLLIGTNPLPNYLACLSRVKDNGQIYFLYTEDNNHYSGTKNIAENLKKLIDDKQKGNKVKVRVCINPINKSDHNKINTTVDSLLRRIDDSSKVVELNYTGGTKAMSVHSYLTFEKYEKRFRIIYTYMDGEQECVLYKGYGIDRSSQPYRELACTAEISLQDICDLHSIKMCSVDDKNINQSHLEIEKMMIEAILNEIQCNGNLQMWNNFIRKLKGRCEYMVKRAGIEEKQTLQSKDDLLGYVFLNDTEVDSEIKIGEENFLKGCSKLSDIFNKINDKYGFYVKLNGTWLEEYVLNIIRDLAQDSQNEILDYGHSVQKSQVPGSDKFEVDIAVLRKYKFFGISVTTSKGKPVCKQKLFEIKERATQLGGDEAGIGLICFYHDSRKLEQELAGTWKTTAKKNLKVIGLDRLPELQRQLKDWIVRDKGV